LDWAWFAVSEVVEALGAIVGTAARPTPLRDEAEDASCSWCDGAAPMVGFSLSYSLSATTVLVDRGIYIAAEQQKG
jgi:hypothetical protein